ncbi:MAG: asparagine--tRNA ligase [Spirochaetales bacterium]|nr:asparagine--tRNA ligase [Spirochaetales bacterium]
MKNLRIKQIISMKADNQEMTVHGWIRSFRDSKAVCFIALNDGSCLSNLQIVIDRDKVDLTNIISDLTTGASVAVTGQLVASPKPEQPVELDAQTVQVLGPSPSETYPLQKKRHSFEFLREIAHLRPRTNTFSAVMRVRNALSFAIHHYFQEHGFLYIQTPIITASDCEGAGEMFQVTTLPLDNIPKENNSIDFSKDFFGKKASLTVSGQLEGEIMALALGNIYTFGPTFRAEHSNTSRHLAEFWMVEPEMAFCDINGDMDIAEEFLKYIISHVLENCEEDMAFFDKWVDPGKLEVLQQIVKSSFTRITYTQAIEELLKSKEKFEFKVEWGIDLQSEHEKFLTEKVYNNPVIITDYPKQIKAFYMKQNDDGKTVRAMDILVPRIGEIIGGSEREDRLDVLTARLKDQNLPVEEYWWYLELRKYGSAPHAGFGLGFERMVQFVTGMQNIRDVIPFPRAYGSAEF